jgi:predicted PurR-regulated permease PerM
MKKSWSIQSRYMALAVALLLLALLIYYARPLISPLVVAALLAYVLDPAVVFLERKARLTRRWAAPIVYAIFLVVMTSIPAITAPIFLAQMDVIQKEVTELQENISILLANANIFGVPLFPHTPFSDQAEWLTIFSEPQRVFGILMAATENLAWILIILVVTFYFLLDGDLVKRAVLLLSPAEYRDDAARLIRGIQGIWQAYLRGQLLLMFIIGLLSWIAGTIVGLPGALLIGLTAGALDVIPSLGPAIAMVIAGVVAYLEGSTFLPFSRIWFALLVVGLFAGIQAFENVWLRPRILGQSLRLHPAIVFVAIVGALSLAGVVAALVIVPLISTAQLVGRYFYKRILDEPAWPEEAPQEEQPIPTRVEPAQPWGTASQVFRTGVLASRERVFSKLQARSETWSGASRGPAPARASGPTAEQESGSYAEHDQPSSIQDSQLGPEQSPGQDNPPGLENPDSPADSPA